MTKNKILCYIATLGTLFATTAYAEPCASRADARSPQAKPTPVKAEAHPSDKGAVQPVRRAPAVIKTQPLQIQVAPAPVVIVAPVAVAAPVQVVAPVVVPAPVVRPRYRRSVISGTPTAGTLLGNTMGFSRYYYREYR